MEILPSYSTFYEAFISAITGAVSLDLAWHHKLIPLGSRTFFTTTGGNCYENKSAASNCDLRAISLLATLDVEITSVGKLVISLRALPQPGLERLSTTGTVSDLVLSQHSVDLWLAPNGTIARLVTEDGGISASVSPGLSGVSNYGDGGQKSLDEASRKEWKQNVSQWLRRFGITLPEVGEDSWLEVEVVSPFDVKPMDSSLRHAGFETPQSTLKRILWPSRLCFKRTKSSFPSAEEYLGCSIVPSEDPLEFAEKWSASADPRNKPLEEMEGIDEGSEVQQQEQPKPTVSSPQKTEVPEVLDSLARTVNFPDLQSANSVYPTPPDGALIHGLGAVPSSSDGFGALASDSAYFTSQMQNEMLPGKNSATPSASYCKDSDMLMAGFAAQSSDYAIGSGLYDTGADDEDLFGGMGEDNFDSKGITEADFNFFDEPDLGDLPEDIGVSDPNQFQHQDQFVKPEPEVETPNLLGETMSTNQHDSGDGEIVTSSSSRGGNTTRDAHHSQAISSNNNLHELPEAANSQLPGAAPNARRQTLSPPLSPVEIKKILFSDQKLPRDFSRSHFSEGSAAQKRSHYGAIPFQQNLNNSDQKYSTAGRFWFPPEGIKPETGSKPSKDTSDIPTVGLPKRGRKPVKSKQAYTPHTNPDSNGANAREDETNRWPSFWESDESEDDSDVLSESDSSPTFITGGMKRKRMESNLDESTTSSLEKLSLSNELVPNNRGVEENSTFLGNFFLRFVDWPFTGFFSLQESRTSPALARRDNYIQIAQLLVDQVTQSSFSYKLDGLSQLAATEHLKYSMHNFLHGDDVLGETSRLTMEDLINTPGTDSGQSTHQKKINSSQRNGIHDLLAKIPPPHIRIRRGNAYVEVLPPAIAFWETFGLEPAKGKKNILSYCIHPHDAVEGADAFLERMGLVYSSCNLGTHSRGSSAQTFDDGLVSWNADSGNPSYQLIMKAIRSICEILGESCVEITLLFGANFVIGSVLSKIPPSDDNLLVYIVNPFSNAVAMADLCSAFLFLFQKYIGDSDRQHVRQLHELVLQIVPIDFVSSPESIVVPAQVEYLNLALEVYNRCPPQNSPCDLTGSASALSLTKSPPKAIDFKLLPDQPSPLQESRCLHLAYSLSSDQRWVTAAWTDKTGSFQMTMSYCLRNKRSGVSRLISSVRQEIWETSRDIMEKFQARWRVFLVRDEPIDMEEVEGETHKDWNENSWLFANIITAWVSFANQQNHTRPTKVELIILSANTNPGLVLELPPQLPAGALNNMQAATYITTPVATPSPDPTSGAANAPTPTEHQFESESDTALIDVSDETWCAILSRRLNNSNTLLEYHPALASGYLIRRSGISDNDGVVAMSVNLIHVNHGHGVSLLRDVLHMYRDLATLARAKGLSHVRHNTLPWHIASAVKGQEIMSYVL